MNESSQKRSRVLKITSIVIAALVVAALVGLTTVLVLRTVMPKKVATLPSSAATIATPADVIDAYKAPKTIAALSDSQYDAQEGTSATSGSVYYRSDDQSYAATTPTKESLTYTATSADQADDTKAVQSQTTAFMNQEGLSQVDTPARTTNDATKYVTYTNDKTVCQLADTYADPSAAHVPTGTTLHSFHQLSCTTKQDIQKEYVAIQKLLNLDATTKQLADLQQVVRTTISEGDKSLSFVNTTDTQGKTAQYLFAAVKGNWEYIGNLSGPQSDSNHATKYTLSPAVQKAISDPKYGNFLTKYVH